MSYGMIYYLISLLTGLSITFGFLLVIGFVYAIIGLFMAEDYREYKDDEHRVSYSATFYRSIKMRNYGAIAVFLLSIIVTLILIPSKKDVMVILGLNLAQTPIEETVVGDMGEMYPELKELIKQELKQAVDNHKE